jgi:hypothetical protein
LRGLNENIFSYFDLKLEQVLLNNETSKGIVQTVRLRLERTLQRHCERVNHTVTLFMLVPLAWILNINTHILWRLFSRLQAYK